MTTFPIGKYIHFQPWKLSPFLGNDSQSTHHMPHALFGAGDITVLNKIDESPCIYGGGWLRSALVWICVSLPNSHVEIVMPDVMVLGGGMFGRWIDPEGRSSYKGGFRESPSPYHHVRVQQEGTSYEPGRGPSRNVTTLVPWLWTSQPPEVWEINFHCL